MKRILTVLVVLGFVIGMAACAGKKAEEPEIIEDDIMEMPEDMGDLDEVEPVAETAPAAPATATERTRTTVKTVEVIEEVKEEAPKRRGGGTSGN